MSQPSAAPILDRPDTDTTIDDAFRELTGYQEQEDDGCEKDRFSHYASKEDIARSNETGVPIIALCGKKWKPSRNPQKYQVCPTCQEVYARMKPGDDE